MQIIKYILKLQNKIINVIFIMEYTWLFFVGLGKLPTSVQRQPRSYPHKGVQEANHPKVFTRSRWLKQGSTT